MYDLQKANMWKRVSAYIFDLIMLFIVVMLAAFVLSSVLGYNDCVQKLDACYEKYTEKYGVEFGISVDEFNALPKDEQKNYELAQKEIEKDKEVSYYYNMSFNLTIIIITFSILIAYLILELLIPLLFKNGQTLGKKIFGIGVMRVDGVRLTSPLLFARAILGKYTIETMIPVICVIMLYFNVMGFAALVIIGAVLVIQLAMLISSRTASAIHDRLSSTVAVDLASQMIFETTEEMLKYKEKLHEEKVKNIQA